MRGSTAIMLAAAALVAGCSHPHPGATAAPSGAVTAVVSTTTTVDVAAGSTVSPVATGAPPTTPATSVAAPVGSVTVSGDELPVSLLDAYVAHGGELADPAIWYARYDTAGLPRVTGARVRLVEVTIDAKRMTDGWQRRDELQWLFEDTSHDGVDAVLDDLAGAAGVNSWVHDHDTGIVDGANCTTRTYTRDGAPVWRVQGCAYPKFPGLYAAGVARDARFGSSEAENVEPTAQQVAGAVNGRIDAYTVTFGRPGAVGSVATLRTTVTLSFTGAPTATAKVLARGPLAGWQRSPGEDSIMLSSGSASSWVIGSATATFRGEGRLRP